MFKSFFCFWGCTLLFFSLTAQVQDDFSDGDFTSNPAWTGDTDRFQVNADLELQSNGLSANDVIYLATSSSRLNDTEWRIHLRYDFDPSTSNQIRFYLLSDQSDLEGDLNGYFVGVGESGSADSYDLFRQDSNSVAKIIDGLDSLAGSGIDVVLRVIRDNAGNWELWTDSGQTGLFQSEGSIFDDTYLSGSGMGLWVKHTSSRRQSFFFDDVYVGEVIEDTLPPDLLGVEILSANELRLQFSEPLDANSTANVSQYQLDPGLGNPLAADLNPGDATQVDLEFNNAFQQNTQYTLSVSGLSDLAGNAIADTQTQSFLYLVPEPSAYRDVVLNEVFPDPSPSVGLPDAEYLELLNRSSKVLNLSGWTLDNGSTQASLPGHFLLPGDLVTLTRIADTALFSHSVLGLTTWPTLVNSGDELTLRNEQGQVIDSVRYQQSWYGDPEKEDGGYSLELINPENLDCPAVANWKASEALPGGTPGQTNSVYDPNPETIPPQLAFIQILNPSQIQVCFDEAMDEGFLLDPAAYAIVGLGSPQSIAVQFPEQKCVILNLASPLPAGLEYTLSIANLADCSGNYLLGPVTTTLLIGEELQFGDLVLTEIFPDGDPAVALPDVEYVEVYNRSAKALSLSGLQMSDASSTGRVERGVLQSGEYALLAREEDSLTLSGFGQVVVVRSFPSLNNSADSLYLRTAQDELLEFAFYDPSWFRNPEKAGGGWSLEKINPELFDCFDPANWTASDDPQGGTPGTVNSVNGPYQDQSAPQVRSLSLPEANTLILRFSEQMEEASLSNTSHYKLSPGLGEPLLVSTQGPTFQQARLVFDSELDTNVVYQLSISNLLDCAGNQSDTLIYLGLPVASQPGDVLINEILFNPYPGGSDFVEIYNASSNILDLKDIRIGEGLLDLDTLFNADVLSEQSVPFLPGQLLCLTSDVAFQRLAYLPPDSAQFWPMSGFPTYDDAAGVCLLQNERGQTLDSLAYLDDFHYPTLVDDEGVSLERISLRQPTADIFNWHSAAATVNYATPGYANSQAFVADPGSEEIKLNPQTFSPNEDGVDDILGIEYQFPFPGANARISIFDTQGRLIKVLQPNVLLSPEAGTFFWDGTDSNNTRADIGMYVVLVELTNQSDGSRQAYRQVCVLADRF
jgi:hypothetical protein